MSLKATCNPAMSAVVQVWLSYPHVLFFFAGKRPRCFHMKWTDVPNLETQHTSPQLSIVLQPEISWSSNLRRFSSCPTAWCTGRKIGNGVVPLLISQPCGDISTKPPAVTSDTPFLPRLPVVSAVDLAAGCGPWKDAVVAVGGETMKLFRTWWVANMGAWNWRYLEDLIHIIVYLCIYIYTIGDNWRIWSVKFGSSPFEMGRLTKCEHWAPRWMNMVSFLKPYLEGFLPTSSLKKPRPRGICLWNFIVGNPWSKNHHSSWKIEVKVMSLPSGNLTWLSKLTVFKSGKPEKKPIAPTKNHSYHKLAVAVYIYSYPIEISHDGNITINCRRLIPEFLDRAADVSRRGISILAPVWAHRSTHGETSVIYTSWGGHICLCYPLVN